MNKTHTPGPWAASSVSMERGSIGVTAGRFVIADVHNGVSAFDVVFGRDPEVQWANARLIAAAPDLLQALRGLADECELAGHGTDEDFAWPERMKAARAAIEKATGSV